MTGFDTDRRHTSVEECQTELDDCHAALRTRPAIDQAKGILIAEHGCTPDEAFQMLADASQRDNRKVADLAQAIVDSAQDDEA